jgi:hypothetical protein
MIKQIEPLCCAIHERRPNPPNNMEEARTHDDRPYLLSPATVTQLKLTALVPSRPASLGPVRVAWRGGVCSQVKDCAIVNRTVGARRSPNQTDGDNDDGWVPYYCVPAETETETVVCVVARGLVWHRLLGSIPPRLACAAAGALLHAY